MRSWSTNGRRSRWAAGGRPTRSPPSSPSSLPPSPRSSTGGRWWWTAASPRSCKVVSVGTPLDRIKEIQPGAGRIALCWLGQAGFIVRGSGATALIDPFLAPYEGRLYESALPPAAAAGVDLVLCTHEHVDHFDADSAPAIAQASPGAVFVVPSPIVDMVV